MGDFSEALGKLHRKKTVLSSVDSEISKRHCEKDSYEILIYRQCIFYS